MFKFWKKDTRTNEEKRMESLAKAEKFDAFRIIPRLIVFAYGASVGYMAMWFMNIKTYTQTECQESLFIKLLDRGMTPEQVKELACTVTAVVGGPTTATTVFVTTICGLAAVIFAFYTNSGRDWSKGVVPWKWRKGNEEDSEDVLKNEDKEEIKRKIDEL